MTSMERWLVPGLLVAVAVAQCVLVITRDLSPWKGGGFGMFSSTDAPSMRVVSGEAVTTGGETIRVRALRALSRDRRSGRRAMPGRRGLEALGAELMEMLFVPVSLQDDAAAAKLRAENPDLAWVFDPADPGAPALLPARASNRPRAWTWRCENPRPAPALVASGLRRRPGPASSPGRLAPQWNSASGWGLTE